LERFVFTGRMPFLTPNQAHQVSEAAKPKKLISSFATQFQN
jgi:hypothetical protein